MRNVRWLAAAGLLVSASGCVDLNGYPATSMNGYPGGYQNAGYYGQPAASNGGDLLSALAGLGSILGQTGYAQPAPVYYQPAPAYYPQAQPIYYPQTQQAYYPAAQPRYVPVPMASSPQVVATQAQGRSGSSWRNRDSNGDGIPDRLQRRGPTG